MSIIANRQRQLGLWFAFQSRKGVRGGFEPLHTMNAFYSNTYISSATNSMFHGCATLFGTSIILMDGFLGSPIVSRPPSGGRIF